MSTSLIIWFQNSKSFPVSSPEPKRMIRNHKIRIDYTPKHFSEFFCRYFPVAVFIKHLESCPKLFFLQIQTFFNSRCQKLYKWIRNKLNCSSSTGANTCVVYRPILVRINAFENRGQLLCRFCI